MKQWIKTSICAMTIGAMLPMSALAAGLSVNFNQEGTSASVSLTDVTSGRVAAEVTFQVSGTEGLQYAGTAETHAMSVNSTNQTVTLYMASQGPINANSTTLDFGTLKVPAGVKVTQAGNAVLIDRDLGRTELTGITLDVTQEGGSEGGDGSDGGNGSDNGNSGGGSSGGSSSGGSSGGTTVDKTPTVTVNGKGGSVKAGKDGTVTITPDKGYRIAKILVNGKEVAIQTKLTGLKASDKVEVTFELDTEQKPNVSFTDVKPTDWYAEAVQFVVERGLFQGESATTFAPNANMSRAMLVTVLYRLSGDGMTAEATSAFPDVPVGTWYTDAVRWAKANQIVNGVEPDRFAPNDSVTREQTAAILSRYSMYKKVSMPTGELTFADKDKINPYAKDAVASMQAAGLIQGRENNQFMPQDNITRAEVATILMRYVKMIESR